eukprot:evm.model.scf_1645.1 EVM.evm.TU.scf_1645.1   scf_1645:7861-13002(-)
MTLGDESEEACPGDVSIDPPYDVMGDQPQFLQELAGDVYLDMANVNMGQRLGEGGFAVVHKAELKTEDGTHTVAIKALKPGVIEDNEDMKELIQEANLLRKVHHRYIVGFCGVGSSETESVEAMRGSVFFAEEFMAGGTLKHLIMKQMKQKLPRRYKLTEALRWCIQIAEALSYLHNSTPVIVHRDMKPENVLLTTTDTEIAEAKIADFGLHKRLSKIHKKRHSSHALDELTAMLQNMEASQCAEGSSPKEALSDTERDGTILIDKQRHDSPTTQEKMDGVGGGKNVKKGKNVRHRRRNIKLDGSMLGILGSVAGSSVTGMAGSLMYIAPEVLQNQKYNEKVDVFGFAVVMYELFRMELTIVRLLAPCKGIGNAQTKQAIRRYALSVSRGLREPIPQHWPPAIRNLIRQSWCQDPKKRPSIQVVLGRLTEIAASGVVEKMDEYIDRHAEDQDSPTCGCCTVS